MFSYDAIDIFANVTTCIIYQCNYEVSIQSVIYSRRVQDSPIRTTISSRVKLNQSDEIKVCFNIEGRKQLYSLVKLKLIKLNEYTPE